MIWVEYQLTSPSFLAAAIKAASAAKAGPPASETTSAKMIVKVGRAMVSPLLCSFGVQPRWRVNRHGILLIYPISGAGDSVRAQQPGDCDKTRAVAGSHRRGFSGNFTSI